MPTLALTTHKALLILCFVAAAAAMLAHIDSRAGSKPAHRRMIAHPMSGQSSGGATNSMGTNTAGSAVSSSQGGGQNTRGSTLGPTSSASTNDGQINKHMRRAVSATVTSSASGDGSESGMPTAVQATGAAAVSPTAVYSCPAFQQSSLTGSHVGQMTYFDATGTGGCGNAQTEQTPLVAVSHCLFDAVAPNNPNSASFCNKSITINFNGDGSVKPVTVPVMDKCMGCSPNDIDLSLAAWNSVSSAAPSRFLDVSWEWA